ncbi:MAG: hypothetical protein J07HQW1_01328 [Haloquadratum walsbyi J07HQW1]|uniref:Uncharacterized protein n=1 Tax=Haloquadratum walsbyi J07HQW1 TaxID=1238424 RepID=U1MN95_9EURY|nr:MAG: hypothetical protein J07HQW1_01328 [Haloquadratum walsbyi J07HQW1]
MDVIRLVFLSIDSHWSGGDLLSTLVEDNCYGIIIDSVVTEVTEKYRSVSSTYYTVSQPSFCRIS